MVGLLLLWLVRLLLLLLLLWHLPAHPDLLVAVEVVLLGPPAHSSLVLLLPLLLPVLPLWPAVVLPDGVVIVVTLVPPLILRTKKSMSELL